MRQLEKYRVITSLYESPRTLVLRVSDTQGQPIILKILKTPRSDRNDHIRFNVEYKITKDIHGSGIIQLIGLDTFHNMPALILEDFGGHSLDKHEVPLPADLNAFFDIVLAVTKSLNRVHTQHIIHKDINPTNIVWNPQNNQVKLIDFGIASKLIKGHAQVDTTLRLEGTLAYMSPEQTGRMNRVMDYRTDLYSLGITCYYLLLGQLPFDVDEPQEFIHHHIARHPEPPSQINPEIPEQLSAIIMKLLAKEPANRYHSARGLQIDLETLRDDWEKRSHHSFPLGRQDIPIQLHISQTFYGRTKELDILHHAYDNTALGSTELVTVSGNSGMGKSMLILESRKQFARHHGFFASGKFDPLNRNTPYLALIQIFKSLVRQWITEDDRSLSLVRNKLQPALDPNGQVIIDLIPEIKWIIGEQPAIPQLPPDETKNRFMLVFRNLLAGLACQAHPLTIFLDDMQWSDAATLEWLENVLCKPSIPYVLLILAYRTDEVDKHHPFFGFLEKKRLEEPNLESIELEPMPLACVNCLIADTLRRDREETHGLATLCRDKTGGNPFFLTQFLHSAYDRQWIHFKNDLWQWNIQAMERGAITINVADLMADKLQRLREDTQYYLFLAACLGHLFTLSFLASVCNISKRLLEEHLREAVNHGLINPTASNSTDSEHKTTTYRFIHDRVRQAAYHYIAEEKRASIHLRIGRHLLACSQDETQRSRSLFDIINHLNRGLHLINDLEERLNLSLLNFQAGSKAKESAAFEPAWFFLKTAMKLLPQDTWSNYYTNTFKIYINAIEVLYLNTRFDEMKRLADIVLTQKTELLDQARVYEVLIHAYSAIKQQTMALNMGRDILKILGISIPLIPSKSRIMFEFVKIRLLLIGRSPSELLALREMSDPYRLASMRILASMLSAAYFGDPDLFPILVFRQIELSIQYGNTNISPIAYNGYGLFLCGIIGDIESGFAYYRLATRLDESYTSSSYKTQSCVFGNLFVRHWKEHLNSSLPDLLNGYKAGIEVGDHQYAAYALLTYLEHAWFLGNKLDDVAQEIAQYTTEIKRIGQDNIDYLAITHQTILNLINRESGRHRLVGTIFNEEKSRTFTSDMNHWTFLWVYHYHKLLLCYLFQKHEEGDKHALMAKNYVHVMVATFDVVLVFYFDALNKLQLFDKQRPYSKWKLLRSIADNRKRLKKWAHHAPMNFLQKYHLVEAEVHRVSHHDEQARTNYEKAIFLAEQHGYGLDTALAHELAGRFNIERNLVKMGRFFLQQAMDAYLKCGAVSKALALTTHYPELSSKWQPSSTSENLISSSISEEESKFLDLPSILKASHAISEEMDFHQLMEKLLGILLRNAGAQRGCLISTLKTTPVIEVTGEMISGKMHLSPDVPVLIDGNNKQPLASPEIVQFVIRTNEVVVLDNAMKDNPFDTTGYVQAGNIKSILCIPLNMHGSVIGAIYLENNLTTASFTNNRVRIVRLLATQAAISMTNAQVIEELKTTGQQLLQSQAQLRKLSQHQQLIRENEQKRIAREIHDELGSLLTRIKMELDLLENYSIRDKTISSEDIAAISQLTSQSIQTTRRIATALRPKILDQCGILSALRWQAEQFKKHFSVAVDPRSQTIRLDENREIMLFRIGQEAITNIARHAKATQVKLAVYFEKNTIILTVEDNGLGMPKAGEKTTHSMGIKSMQERTAQLGGTIQFSRSDHGGTRINVSLPKQPTDRIEEES